jgi:F-type H+-transporting ATPase subunit beta
VKIEETIASFKEILDGKVDDIPEQAFLYVGGIDEVKEAARGMGWSG